MDGSCGSVSLDAYWNNVAVPFLFIILGFGLFVLFSLSDIQFAGTEHIIRSAAAAVGSSRRNSRPPPAEGNSAPPSPRAPEPPLALKPIGESVVNADIAARMAANAARGVGKTPAAAPANNIGANLARGVGKTPAAAPAPAAPVNAIAPYKPPSK